MVSTAYWVQMAQGKQRLCVCSATVSYTHLDVYKRQELDVMQVPEHLQNYIDYEAYGRDVALEENGTFTNQGYVRDTGCLLYTSRCV